MGRNDSARKQQRDRARGPAAGGRRRPAGPRAEALERRLLLAAVDYLFSHYALPDKAAVATAGDFNGDGKADVAYLTAAGLPRVAPGNGDGTFAAAVTSTGGLPAGYAAPTFVYAADVTGDGKPDLLTADYNAGTVAVYRGTGDGSFQAPAVYAAGGAGPHDVTVGDFNGDGRLDVATANTAAKTVGVLLQTPAGTLSPGTPAPISGLPWHLTAADFDADGRADVVVADAVLGLALLRGNGDGTFAAPTAVAGVTYSTPQQNQVSAPDMNADGRPDLLVALYGQGAAAVLLNAGGGSFAAGTSFGFGSGDSNVFAGNFTNDGRPDVLSVGGGGAEVYVGSGTGTFSGASPYTHPPGGPWVTAVADFDGDGLTDVAAPGNGRLDVALSKPLVALGGGLVLTHVLTGATVATGSSNIAPGAVVSGVTATVDWGDGRTSPGTIVADGVGSFHVTASHTWAYNLVYNYTVSVTLPGGRTFAVASGTGDVRDAPPPPTVTESYYKSGYFPYRIVPAAGGDLWFGYDPQTLSASAPATIARLHPQTGQVIQYPIAGASGAGGRLLASDAGGNAWFTVDATHLGRVDAATGAMTQYAVPAAPNGALARGPDGDVWFTVAGPTQNGRSTTAQLGHVATTGPGLGTVTLVTLGALTGSAGDLTAGPDGNLWMTEPLDSRIARISTAGAVTEFPLSPVPTPSATPSRLTAGPDGNVWFTEQQNGKVGRITPAGAVTLYPVGGDPYAITAGPDGAVWFINWQFARVVRIAPDGNFTVYTIPNRTNPNLLSYGIAAGGDGSLWFTESATGAVVKVDLHEAALVTLTPPTTARKGVPFSGEVARFTDGTLGAPGDYDVTILWGDSSSPGTLVPLPGGGGYAVNGSHTYAVEGNMGFLVLVTQFGDATAEAHGSAVVDYPLTTTKTYQAFGAEGRASDANALMTFADSDPDGTYGPFTATVDWGDGQTSSGTAVAVAATAAGANTFDVSAGHAYAREGTYAVRVTVTDAGGATAVGDTTARVADDVALMPPAGYDAPAGRVAVGDVNGDGRADLFSASPADPRVALLLGAGGGAFQPAVTAATVDGTGVVALATADFNRDGRADLAVTAGGTGPHTEIYLGNANGTLTAAGRYASRTGTVAAGDFNGDGWPDVVTADPAGDDLAVLLGGVGGAFTAAPAVPLAGGTSSLAVADFNRDGRADVAAVLAGTTTVRVLLGRADGTFDSPAAYNGAAVAAGAGGGYVAAGDFDGDGNADVAVADSSKNALTLLTNAAGDGGFVAASGYRLDESVAAGANAGTIYGLVAADVNADGAADLVRVTDGPSPRLNVRLGQGAAAARPFLSDIRFNVTGPGPLAAAVADLNGDRRPDAVVGAAGRAHVLLNTPYTVAASTTLTVTEGATLSGAVVATVTHEDPPADPQGLTAAVDWGDGTTSAATLAANGSGGLNAVASHVYRRAGTYATRVVVTDAFGVRTTGTGSVKVNNAALAATARAVAATINAPVTAVVATFTDANPFSDLADFSASIDWGNGRATQGIVRATGAGTYSVTGTQTYAASGTFTVKTTITDAAGGTAPVATATATVNPLVNGGGSISGTVYNDLNFDGGRQAGEPPLFTWTVYVDANGNRAFDAGETSALSSSAGTYTLADVAAGQWTVRQVVQDAWRQTAPADAAAGRPVTLARGQAASGVDFGDTRRPTAVVDAGPSLRAAPLDAADVTFSEPVTGFDLADLTLSRDGGADLLGGTGAAPQLVTSDNTHFRLTGLAALTAADGSYALAVSASGSGIADVDGDPLLVGVVTGFDVAAAPAVQSVRVNDGTAQRSMVSSLTVTFDRPVVPDAGAFTVVGRSGAGAGTVVMATNPTGDGSTWVLTFAGPSVVGGSLADGVYDLTVVAAKVHDVASPSGTLPADYAFAFHRLYSDVNGDGISDNADLFQMRSTYLKPGTDPSYKWYFDYNADGVVDNADVFQVRSRRSLVFQGY